MSCYSQRKKLPKEKNQTQCQTLIWIEDEHFVKKILTFCDSVRETPLVSDDESLSGKLSIKAV